MLRWDLLDGPKYDLELEKNRQLIRGWIRAGHIRGWHAGFPCQSFSRARDRPGGPPRLRSAIFPKGLPDLAPHDIVKVKCGNLLLQFCVGLALLSIHQSVPFTLENPELSYAWEMPSMKVLLGKPGMRRCTISFCMFGAPWRKNTAFVSYLVPLARLEKFRCTGRVCDRTGLAHQRLEGQRACDTMFWTKIAEPYPPRLCQLLAASFIDESARARCGEFERLTAGPEQLRRFGRSSCIAV